MSGNPFLARIWGLIYEIFLTMRWRMGIDEHALNVSNERHKSLVLALESGDREVARTAVLESLAFGEANLAARLGKEKKRRAKASQGRQPEGAAP